MLSVFGDAAIFASVDLLTSGVDRWVFGNVVRSVVDADVGGFVEAGFFELTDFLDTANLLGLVRLCNRFVGASGATDLGIRMSSGNCEFWAI